MRHRAFPLLAGEHRPAAETTLGAASARRRWTINSNAGRTLWGGTVPREAALPRWTCFAREPAMQSYSTNRTEGTFWVWLFAASSLTLVGMAFVVLYFVGV